MNSSTSNQEIDDLEKTNLNNKQESDKNWKFWMSLVEILVTLVIGVGIALFIHFRDEKLQLEIIGIQATIDAQFNSQQAENQKELAKWQAEIERESKIANIEVNTTTYLVMNLDSTLVVNNLGPADANDFKMILYSPTLTDIWLPAISDVNSFDIQGRSALPNFTVSPISIELVKYTNISGEPNAIEIVVDNLRANSNVLLDIRLSSNFPVESFVTRRHIIAHTENYEDSMDRLTKWLDNQHKVATFQVDYDCVNCDITTGKNEIDISTISFLAWEYINQSENTYEFYLTYSYLMPESNNHKPQTSDIVVTEDIIKEMP